MTTIKITAERVETFESSGGVPENIGITGSVICAALANNCNTGDLQFLEQVGTQVRKLLKGISSSKNLVLSGFSAKVS